MTEKEFDIKTFSILTTFALSIAMMFTAFGAHHQQNIVYRISGVVVESCSGQVLGPCPFGEDATSAPGCQASSIFHIENGHYGNVKLDKLTTLVMILKPTRNVMESVGEMEGGLYIDQKASQAQHDALKTIFTEQLGPLF